MLVVSCQQELKPDMSAEETLLTQADMFGPVKRRLDFIMELLMSEGETLKKDRSPGDIEMATFLENISETLYDLGLTIRHVEAFSNHAHEMLSEEQPATKANGKAKPKSTAKAHKK